MSRPPDSEDDDGLDPGMLPPELVPFLRPYQGPALPKAGEDPEFDDALAALREFERQVAEAQKAAEQMPAPASEASAYLASVSPPKSNERTQEMLRVRVAAEVAPPAEARACAVEGDESAAPPADAAVVVAPRPGSSSRATTQLKLVHVQRRSRAATYAVVTGVAVAIAIGVALIGRGESGPASRGSSDSAPPIAPSAVTAAPALVAPVTAAPALVAPSASATSAEQHPDRDVVEAASATAATETVRTSKPRTPRLPHPSPSAESTSGPAVAVTAKPSASEPSAAPRSSSPFDRKF